MQMQFTPTALIGPSGRLSIREDDPITRKLAMLYEGECTELGPLAAARKYGFSKRTLSSSCEGLGIRYEHLPELGIDGERRRDLHTQTDYDALFLDYKRDDLPKQRNALDRIVDWVKDGERVALTCYEIEPRQCHRHCVAEALERAAGNDWRAEHL